MTCQQPSPFTPVTVRGRGTSRNPPNRFEARRVEPDPDALGAEHGRWPAGRQLPTRIYRDQSRTVINRVDSPDLGFRWTVNPYRGCSCGCAYCYARPTHEALGFSSGLDFESRIVAKFDAPAILRRELAAPRWTPEPIVMSGVTDPYQPLEAKLRITRGCLEVLAECRQPVTVVTKSRRVLRDLDLLADLARHGAGAAAISLTTLDQKLASVMEPRASCPQDRLRAVRELARAGVPVTVLLAPIIPGLNDREIPRLLEAAAGAGARNATWIMLRLPQQVKRIFLDWLHINFPHGAARVEGLIRSVRGGRLYDPAWSARARGAGPIAGQIATTFKVFAKRHGLDRPYRGPSAKAFRRPTGERQLTLFDSAA